MLLLLKPASGTGAFVFDGAISTLVYSGGGRYVDFVSFTPIPEPSGLIALGTITGSAVGLGWRRRRRRLKYATRRGLSNSQIAL